MIINQNHSYLFAIPICKALLDRPGAFTLAYIRKPDNITKIIIKIHYNTFTGSLVDDPRLQPCFVESELHIGPLYSLVHLVPNKQYILSSHNR